MNTIETLPKSVECDGDVFFLTMYITAWDKYCLCYRGMEKDEGGNRKTILSVVVEGECPDKPEYKIPDDINIIADAVDFDDAVRIIRTRINKNFKSILRYSE